MILTDVSIYAENQVIDNGWIEIRDGKIFDFGAGKKAGISFKGLKVVPGFIDVHFHGSFGYDLMLTNKEGYKVLSTKLLANGVTSYLPTTLTDSKLALKKALTNLSSYIENQPSDVAQMLGIHLEGPFISKHYPGAQDQKYIIKPDLKTFKEFNKYANNQIKYITFAPEVADTKFIRYLKQNNIIASAGHSAATYEEIEIARKLGVTNITHFNNAHSGYHHRKPGMVNAGLAIDDLNLELIVDKLHVAPSVVRMVDRIKQPNKLLLITDACMASGLKDGKYDLGSQMVTKKGNEIRLSSGTLAASGLNLNQALINMHQITSRKLEDLVLMSSTNQAKLLGLKDRGIIKKGYRADLVLLDANLKVKITILNGRVVYGKI